MKKNHIIAFASLALALVGCSKNEIANPQTAVVTVIEVSAPDTKVAIGEDGLSLNWQVGDKLKVNGVDSQALTADDIISGSSARFTFNGTLKAPYYGMYNAERGYGFETAGSPLCSVNLDTPQAYTEDSFDTEAAVFYGKSETANAFPLQHAMAYLKVTPTGSADAKIGYIMLSSRSGAESLSGRFQLSFEDGALTPVAGNDYVVMQASADGVDLGKPFIIAVPAQEYAQGLRVRIVAVDGTYMERNLKAFTAAAGKLYPVTTDFTPAGTVPAIATAAEVTSSTACFAWTLGKGANTDKAQAWTIQCAASSDFTGATEYTVPANSSAWDGRTPKFCFGGLVQNTTYYFRVKSGSGDWSNVVSSKTLTYDKTVVSANAKAGDVILAEDFAELALHGERVFNAVGVNETGSSFVATWSSYTITNADKNELPTRAASLSDWGFARGTGSANLYANQGYFKLGTGGAQSYLVSPELNAIPAGKKATLEVAVTLAAYPDDKANVTKFFVSSEKGTMSATNMFAAGVKTSNKVEANLAADAAERIKWVTYTVSVENVLPGERLMVGAANNAGNNRIQVSDVKAKITALEDAEPAPVPSPIAAATEVSSSTVSFTWGYEGATAAQDSGCNYEFGLYSDEDCETLIVSYKSTGNQCWEGRKPKFCFGGLQQNTTYYFKVKDTATGKESEVVSAKTTTFANKTVPATAVASGDVILAEDFSELILGGEYVIMAASACTKKADTEIFKTLSGAFPTCYLANKGDEVGMTGDNYDAAKAGKRIANWSYAYNSGSSVYSHVGCVKMGTGSNNTWLTTPVLSAIPDGKTADLEITVTLAAYDDAAVKTAFVYAGNIADKASIADATNVIRSSQITTTVGQWKTYTVTLSGVDNTMRLAIGPDNDTAKTAKGKGRMLVNDVVVKVTALK